MTNYVSNIKNHLSSVRVSKNTNSVKANNMEEIHFGLGGSIYVSNYNPAETLANNALTLPIQSTQPVAISGSNGSFTFSTLTLGNLNGLSFYTSNNSVVGSYTVPNVAGTISNINVSAGTTSNNLSALTFSNGSGVSFGLNGSVVTASVAAQTVQTQNVVDITLAGNTSGTLALISSGTLSLAGGNNITLSQVGNAITISGPNAGGAQTGISGIQVSNTTYTSGSITFQNANGISFGSSGANGISASYTVPSTAGLISNINVSAGATSNNLSALTFSNSNGLSFGLNGSVITGSYTVPSQTVQPVAISGSNGSFTFSTLTAGNLNGLSFYTSNGSLVGSYTVPTQTAQTGLSGIQVSNTTYTSGTISFQNANGISFGSSGANGISASYTVPVQTVQPVAVSGSNGSFTFSTLTMGNLNGLSHYTSNGSIVASYTVPSVPTLSIGVSTGGNTLGNTGTYSGQAVLVGNNNVTLSVGTAAGGAQTISINAPAISSISGTGAVSISVNASTISIGAPVLSLGVSTGGNTLGNTGTYSGQAILVGGNNITLSIATAAGGAQTITISGANAGGAQTGISGVQVSNTTYSSGTITFQNANGISFGSSGANGISASYTVPAPQTGVSGIQVSNTTYTSGTITFQNANGISFGSSGANGISASYTVPTQTVQTVGVYGLSQTTGSASTATYDARSLSIIGAGIISIGNASTSAGGTTTGIIISATQSNQAVSAQGGSSAFQTLVFTNSNNVSFSNTGGSIWGSYALNVSASGGTSNALSGLTFSNLNGVSFGLSTGAGVGTLTASVAAQTAQTGLSGIQVSNTTYTSGTITFQNANGISFGSSGANGISASYTVPTQSNQNISLYGLGNTTQSSSTVLNASNLSFNGLGEISVGYSNGSIQLSAPAQSVGVSNIGNTLGNTGAYSGQVVFAGGNNVTLSVSSGAGGAQTITISGANIGGAQTGISGLQVSNTTYTSGTVTFQNANGISFGSSGANGISASYTVPTVPALSVGVSTGGNTLGNTGIYSGQAVFVGGNNVTLSVSTAAGGAQTITISGANIGGAQTGISGVQVSNTTYSSGTITFQNANGISFGSSGANGISASYTVPAAQTGVSGIQVSNTTYTSGTITFQNANGISFGSSGANGISASYTVPTQTVQTVGVYASSQTAGSASSATYDARSLSIIGAGIISIGNASTSAGGTTTGIIISASQSVQPVAISGSNGSFAFSTLTMGNLNGLSHYTSNGSIVGSYTVPTVPALSVGVSNIGNTSGNTGTYSGQAVFVGGNNVTLSVSTAAGGAQTITISGANIGGAQTGVSGIQVSNTTYTSGTITFQNANGISFGSSGANGISASYTVPTVPALSIGVSTGGNTSGNTGIYSGQAVLAGGNNITLSVSTAAGGAQTISVSAPAISSISGTGAVSISVNASTISIGAPILSVGASNIGNTSGNTGTYSGQVVFAGGNNITLSVSSGAGGAQTITISGPNVGGAQTGISGVQVSNTTYTSGTITFQNANGISFGSSGANGISASYTVPATAGLISGLNVSGGAGNSQSNVSGITFSNSNGITFGVSTGANVATITASYTVPSQTVQPVAISGSNGSFTYNTLTAGNLNGLSFYTSNGSLVGSYTVPSVQTGLSGIQVSNTTYTSGTITFQNANGISFGSSGANGISASYTVPTQTAQTVGVYASSQTAGSASSATYDARSLSIIGAGIISIGNASTSAGGTTTGIIISASQSVQPVAVSGSNGSFVFSTLTMGNLNGLSHYTSNGSIVASYTVPSTAGLLSGINVSAGAGTSNNLSGITFANSNSITFGLSTGAGVGTLTASVAYPAQTVQPVAISGSNGSFAYSTLTAGNLNGLSFYTSNGSLVGSYTVPSIPAAQTGLSGIQVSNTTYTSGTITFQNANGISFGSSGANGISASYTVPTQTVQTVGVYASSQTAGSASSFTYDARSLSIIGAGIISIGNASTSAGGTTTGIIISAVQSVQPVAVSGSNGSFTFSTLTMGNLNGLSHYTSNGSIVGSYTVPTVPALSVGVSNIGNTLGNTGVYSGQVVFAGGNNVTLSVSSGAGGAQTITISGPNVAGAQTGISGVQVSNTTYTSGTITFQNANGISFGSSGANGISASYTVPATAGLISGLNISGGAGNSQSNVSGLTFSNSNGITFGVSTGANVATITASYTVPTQTVQPVAISGSNGSFAYSTLTVGNLNGLSFYTSNGSLVGSYTVPSAQTGLSGIQVSNTTYTSGTITFQNANGISFGSSGANGISASYTVPTQTVQPVAVSGSNGSFAFSTLTMGNLNGASFYTSNGSMVASYTVPTVPALSVGVSTGGNTIGNTGVYSGQVVFAGGNNITLSISSAAGGAQTITISGPNVGGVQTGVSGIQVSNTTYTSGTITFQNANGISFGSSGANGISVSYTVPATAGLISGLNVSGGAGNSQSNVSGLTFLNSNGITFGVSTGANVATITASYTVPTQTAQTGLSGIQVSNTTYTSGTITFQNANGISFGSSGANGISASYTVPTVPALSVGVSNIGNTAGNTGTYSGQVVFAGGNNVTLSVSSGAGGAQTITISGGNTTQFAGTGTTFAGANVSGSMTLNSNGLNLSLSGPTESGVGISAAGSSQTVGNIVFSNSNGLAFGMNGSTVTGSYTVPTVSVQSAGVSGGNTLGNTGLYSGQVVFAGGNNITLSVSSGAAGAQTITVIGGAGGGGGGVALNDGVNTISSGTALFSGVNMTFSVNGQTVSGSVPAISSLSATGQVSISVNGSIISIGAPVQSANVGSFWQPEIYGNPVYLTMPNDTLFVRPFELDQSYDVNRIDMVHQFTSVSTNMSLSGSVSAAGGKSGTGSWGQTVTQLFFTRSQTNVTAANYNSIITMYSNTFSSSAGYSASVSWNTNVSSATVSWTTSAAVAFLSNIDSDGNWSSGTTGSSGSSTFSGTAAGASTFSSSYVMSFIYPYFSSVRAVYIGNSALSTNNMTAGEYWFGLIQSTTTGSTNLSLQQLARMSDFGRLFFTVSTNSYLEIGSSQVISNSGLRPIYGSYATTANTTTVIPLTNFTTLSSHASMWFGFGAGTK